MNFEHATQALDTISQAMRNAEQKHIVNDKELEELRADKEHYLGRLQELERIVDTLRSDNKVINEKHETEVRSNGELKATLKQLLAEQMALAGRAAEMLRSLEEPASTMLPKEPETIKIEQPTFDLNKEHTLLTNLVRKTLKDIEPVPVGVVFTLDAPYGESISDWVLKRWYKRILGKPPNNFREAPSVELRKEEGGRWTFLKQVPKLTNKEEREPLPFRTEEAKPTGNGETKDPFADNGEDIPGFLRGPRHDDDQGRKASDL